MLDKVIKLLEHILSALERGSRPLGSPWLSTREGATYLRMGFGEFRKVVARGEVPSYHRGNTNFVCTDDLDEWMRSLPSGAKVPPVLRQAS